MRRLSLTFIAGVAVLTANAIPAAAFSEVETAPSVPGTTVSEAPAELRGTPATRVGDELPALRMIDPTLASPSDSEGTAVTIPGIGYIGTLPKLDFGLELLYGKPEQPTFEFNDTPAAGAKSETGDDDVIIRGTLKHRF